ncbi:MAG: phosphatase PAP2/dual specificity phosphatase family protein [Chthoniobacteraceae bacterium]
MKRPWLSAAGTVALTGLLFIVAYNVCNRLTGLRSDVGVWAFSWEQYWPVIPAFIVPYWSEDLLFVIAPFLCRTREEIATHRRRIVFCILAGCIGFLLIPLRFAFSRPHVEGVFAPLFAALYAFDLPHNLFPSLHIALRTLLASMFLRVARGPWRWLTHVWFSLVGISTLVTWQHHIVDVLGGFWLGFIALHLYRFDDTPAPRASNPTIAIGYAVLALACSQIARISWPWTFIFVWPAFAFGVGAFGYAGLGGDIYRKRGGRLTWPTKLLFGPLLFLQRLSWIYYRGKSARWNEVTPQVWIGALPTPEIAREAIAAGVTAVLDLTVEFSGAEPFLKTRYCNLQVLDLTAPNGSQLAEAVRFIEQESARGIVFIHCKAGYSRTAGAVGAWLLETGWARSVEEVVAQLEAIRPGIVIRPEIREALRQEFPRDDV